MNHTLAFDVYGTLIDPLGITADLSALVGEAAPEFASLWREKQIEYLFRRGLGRSYQPFSVCTREALAFACTALGKSVNEDAREALLDRYVELPAYPGAPAALAGLRKVGCRNFAFSNGEPDDLTSLLSHAGLAPMIDGIVSVHDVRSFKPDPAVYAHFLERTGSLPANTWLVSANPFDIIGAHDAGWRTAWVRRDAATVFDPWGIEPSLIVSDLDELKDVL